MADALRLLVSLPAGQVAVTRRALPFLLSAEHLVTGEGVLLRMADGEEVPSGADGGVVAYRAVAGPGPAGGSRSVQVIGTARRAVPEPAERAAFGRLPTADDSSPAPGTLPGHASAGPGAHVDPDTAVYLRLLPHLVEVRGGTGAARHVPRTTPPVQARNASRTAAVFRHHQGTSAEVAGNCGSTRGSSRS
ncbi:pyridoxamine 5'-phosphate oxidase family protein [Streptomyces alkaliphilus]|uniref:pyridoxamine 5'-phosphate oxidase family protein n=1 Tax=Streptomyces alkaliphilus TaxID=1472722 RepID=UPI00118120AF|nr:pyridoxamine 5'-phosphate oxidase family protein [Streptomyces alkaliphilus]MQS10187.1 hypothetical protein [Streptomyces alkaliphilus]